MQVEGQAVCDNSLPSPQLCYEPKPLEKLGFDLKKKTLLKNLYSKEIIKSNDSKCHKVAM